MATTQIIDPAKPVPEEVALLKMPGMSRGTTQFPSLNERRIILLGLPGQGKSTLVYSNPKALVIDCDLQGSVVPNSRAYRFGAVRDPTTRKLTYVPDLPAMKATIEKVVMLKRQGKTDIETIVIDTLTAFMDLTAHDYCKTTNVSSVGDVPNGKGFDFINTHLMQLLDSIYSASLGWVLCAHLESQVRRTKEGDDISYAVACWRSTRRDIVQRADDILYTQITNDETVKVIGGVPQKVYRKVCTLQSSPNVAARKYQVEDCKVRFQCPESLEIPPVNGWNVLQKAYENAVNGPTAP